MKRILILAAFLSTVALASDRVTTIPEATIVVQVAELLLQPDGGCAVMALAQATQSDGGITTEKSPFVQVAGVNRTTCLDILQNKAVVLFKSTNGF